MKRCGFTLIELSIVLVIIGLLVGGILTGQELINAAEIRAQVSQLEKLNTAVNTFRQKYGYLPGDMPSSIASRHGFFAVTGVYSGAIGFGDGNSLLEGGGAGVVYGVGETVIFWRHLSDAQMIDGSFGTTSSGNPLNTFNGGISTQVNARTANQIFPRAKTGRGGYITVFAAEGMNFLEIAGVNLLRTDGSFMEPGEDGLGYSLTPVEAQGIDQKTDDGGPMTGGTRAMRDTMSLNIPATLGSPCVTAASLYDAGATNGNVPNCQLRFRSKF